MVRFAFLQLRDEALAEDVVQETLLAALQGASGFAHRAQVKTWLFAILKRKIVDALRARRRVIPLSQLEAGVRDGEAFEPWFTERGRWTSEHRPRRWAEPDESLEQQQFWQIFEVCLDHLPERIAQVFMMREFLELKTEEICQELGLTASNCWVILHRARLGLRRCLDQRWFGNKHK